MMYSCGRPVRPLIHAICAPVLGFQTGETSGPRKLVTRRAWLPSASEVQISGSPVREEENASWLPLGDHAGERLVPPAAGKLMTRLSSSENILTWKPSRPSALK